jgi:ABC-type transporter Mla MlaB component
MMRITNHEKAGSLTLQVEGKLVGPWVLELKHCWDQALSNQPLSAVRVDVSEVTHIDTGGKELLATMHGQGAELIAACCLMKAVVAEVAQTSPK